jgi:putative ABC transport system ATP-binding protein
MNEVSYSYKSKNVLSKQSMKFKEGNMYAIYGSSGSGKTTCLALLGGLEEPDSGEVLLDGENIKQIGYSYLRRHLFPYMNAVENVLTAVDFKEYKKRQKQNHKELSGKEIEQSLRKKAQEILIELGILAEDQDRPVRQLSGGEQQRVAIARALITDSNYILADEPTGNLDQKNSEIIVGIMQRLAHEKGKCVVIVTHSEQVRRMCDESIFLEKRK